jgi:hypothetical protein
MARGLDVGGILAVAIPLILMLGGVGVTLIALRGRHRLKELAFQERIALIEKGLVPSPESNPAGFESALSRRPISAKALRYRSAGVVLTGVGLALTTLLFFVMPTAAKAIGLGVGGALTVLGLTVLGNGVLLSHDDVEGSGRNTPTGG